MSEAKEQKVEQKEEVNHSITNPLVVEKYKTAGDIANRALKLVIDSVKVGSKIHDLCVLADKYVVDETDKIYKSQKDLQKGVAFPCCISLNHIVGHYSPLLSDESVLKNGDFIKVDLGVHIDGHIVVTGHTFVLNDGAIITGKQADVLLAAQTASDAIVRLLKPGNKNSGVSDIFSKISKDFGVTFVQGVLSHQLERFNIDGKKTILNRLDPEHKVDECTIEANEVWSCDIVISSGEGKPKETGAERTTIYKRTDQKYQLKIQSSRVVSSDILNRFPTFPFNMRELDTKTSKMAIKESVSHGLLMPYPVLQERDSEFVAHVKFTVLVTASGAEKISGLPIQVDRLQSEKKLTNEDVKKVLSLAINDKKKKKNNKKKGDNESSATVDATSE